MAFDAVAFLTDLYRPMSWPGAGGEIDVDDLPGDWRVWFEERAAVREYHGGLPRERAEAEALAETVAAMKKESENGGEDACFVDKHGLY